MKGANFYSWNSIDGKVTKPVCSYETGIQMLKGLISPPKLQIVEINLGNVNYPKSKRKPQKSTKTRRSIILSLGKKREIENFIKTNNLNSKKDFIYQILSVLNGEASLTLRLMNESKELVDALKKTKKPENNLKEAVRLYENRYVPKGVFLNGNEIISISFKFSNPSKVITINNFITIGNIMDLLRKQYDFDIPIELNLEAELLKFKKRIAKDLFKFFFSPRNVWGTNIKSKAHSLIEELFSIAEVYASKDVIKKWTS